MSSSSVPSPQQTVDELFRALDALDIDRIGELFSDDAQGVDELSGGWRRGRAALDEYLEGIRDAGMSDLRSTARDVHATEWGDTALVTFVLDQTYTLGREAQAINAPTSVVLRREGSEWRLVLVHSVPLPDQGTEGG